MADVDQETENGTKKGHVYVFHFVFFVNVVSIAFCLFLIKMEHICKPLYGYAGFRRKKYYHNECKHS